MNKTWKCVGGKDSRSNPVEQRDPGEQQGRTGRGMARLGMLGKATGFILLLTGQSIGKIKQEEESGQM